MIDSGKIWFNGKLVEHDEANIHILSHVVHYGSSFFEGIRAYDTANGPAIFRLDEHIERLFNSAKIYRTKVPYSREEIREAILNVLKINNYKSAYIRPVVFRGYGKLGVLPIHSPVEVAVAAWNWGAYLGEDALKNGIDVQVSSWRRLAPNTLPTMAKAGGNYLGSQLIRLESMENGYGEGIGLDYFGNVSEGSGENIFLVDKETIYTPPASSSILTGITRDTIIKIAQHLGYKVEEKAIPREMLYITDEIFFVGTAAEVTPIASVDKILVGHGEHKVTHEIQKLYFDIVHGKKVLDQSWLTYVK